MTEPSRTPKQLPREIYVRRRVAALVAILVLVVVLIFAATALFGGSKKDSAAESQQAAASDTLAPSAEATSATETAESTSAKESTEATGSTEPVKSEAGESGKEEPTSEAKPDELTVDPSKTTCSLQDLKVLAKTNEDSVPAGKMPTFYLEVFNPTTKDCSIDLDEEQLRFEVYKMGSNERVWADTDCYASVETGKQTFKSGETRYFQADWSRKRSEPGKCTEREEAEPGAYFLHTVIGENYSPALPFNLL
ncbi:hypothetical protein [Corynebacterium hesseae]